MDKTVFYNLVIQSVSQDGLLVGQNIYLQNEASSASQDSFRVSQDNLSAIQVSYFAGQTTNLLVRQASSTFGTPLFPFVLQFIS